MLIGLGLYYLPFFPKLYGYGMFVVGVYFVLNSRNRNNEVLYVAAYIVGSEVALRMTDGNPIYEYSKYAVIIFMLIGIWLTATLLSIMSVAFCSLDITFTVSWIDDLAASFFVSAER